MRSYDCVQVAVGRWTGAQPRSSRARRRSLPSARRSRYDQPPSAAHATASTVASASAGSGVLEADHARDRPRGVAIARGDDRLLEPVGVDGVVDVVQRVQLLRANGEPAPSRRPRAARPAAPGPARTSPAGPGRSSSKIGGIRVGAPRASRRTQSMSIQATSVAIAVDGTPSGGATRPVGSRRPASCRRAWRPRRSGP